MRTTLLAVLLCLTVSCDAQMARVDEGNAHRYSNEASLAVPANSQRQADVQTVYVAQGFATGGPKVSPRAPGTAMLVRTARVVLEVSSLDSAIGSARHIVDRHGGFAAGLDRNLAVSWRPQAALTLRVPVSQLDAAVEALATLGEVEAVSIATQDVSEEFVDVTARLENARRLERRLLELLSRGTGKLTDVLQVEEKLAGVREEVERIEGRRRWLQARSDLSTIDLALHEAGTPPAPRTASAFGDAFSQARRNLVVLTTTAIEASGIVLPLVMVAGAGWLVLRRRRPIVPVTLLDGSNGPGATA